MLGYGSSGQLRHSLSSSNTPREVSELVGLSCFCIQSYSCALLITEGLSAGKNDEGQHGVGNKDDNLEKQSALEL